MLAASGPAWVSIQLTRLTLSLQKAVTRYNCTGFLKCNLARHQDQQPARLPRCGMPVRYVAGRFFRVRIPEETANRHQLSI